MRIFKAFAASLMACAALLFSSCEKGVEHTGDETGTLYGNWVLDTKTIVTPTSSGDAQVTETSFVNDHFFLCLVEPQLAFGKEGTLLTFDIDDVDAGKFSYNAKQSKITFEDAIVLSKGFPPRTMSLIGTWDVKKLTDKELILSKEDKIALGEINYESTVTYSYHRLVQDKQ
jgi:hypothetical protein